MRAALGRPGVPPMDPLRLYQDLLSSERPRWLGTIDGLRERLRSVRAQYGGRDLVRVFRPKFVTTQDLALIDYVSGVILGASRRLAQMILVDPKLQAFFGLSEGELRLVAPEPLVPDPCAFTRLDSFLTREGPRFVELNGEAPAGVGYGDVIAESFLEHPLVREFQRRTGAFAVSTREALLRFLLMAWRIAGRTSKPSFLITDYLDVSTVNEFHIVCDYIRARGFDCVVEDPRKLEYRDGKLWAQGRACDFVYRRVLVNEFLDREDQLAALWSAYRDRAVVMVNPFRSKLVHKKITFALLTGDGATDWLTAEERAVIGQHVPWTRKVRETKTEYGGRTVDLVPFVLANRDRFVLKPSDEYGGRGVTLGWLVDQSTFEATMKDALKAHWVVQERIDPVEEPFPHFDHNLEDVPMVVDLDPYVYFGRVHGVLARLSAGAISNVTSGGGQVPVLFVPSW